MIWYLVLHANISLDRWNWPCKKRVNIHFSFRFRLCRKTTTLTNGNDGRYKYFWGEFLSLSLLMLRLLLLMSVIVGFRSQIFAYSSCRILKFKTWFLFNDNMMISYNLFHLENSVFFPVHNWEKNRSVNLMKWIQIPVSIKLAVWLE